MAADTVETVPALPPLAPLPYHHDMARCLQALEPEVWRWACSAQSQEEHAATVRAELLKQTYRLDAGAHPELHEHCTAAARRLGLEMPMTLYQGGDGPMNAALYFLPGEVHVVFTGPLLERLKGPELEAVIGHELSHHLLWQLEGGRFHAADRILTAALNDPRSDASHAQSARLYRLFTEAFADRGSVVACGELHAAVAALVKVQTGLHEVSAPSYLRQAEEVCKPGAPQSEGQSHPEVFVRARALRLWAEGELGADAWLARSLQGPLSLQTLDLLRQQQLTEWTRRVLLQVLRHRSLRSEGLLALARRFFPELQPVDAPDETLAAEITAEPGTHDYVAALLLDFAAADHSLEDVPLAAALQLAQTWGVAEPFERLALKSLALPKRQFQKMRQEAAAIVQRAEQQHA